MIPRSDIPVEIAVDPEQMRSADAETVVDGVACIHEYDPSFYAAATWEGAQGTAEAEAEALAEINAASSDEDEFDEEAYRLQGELFLPLELGVTGAAEALCAAGCPTFASCRGHYGVGFGGRSRHPWLLFAADAERLPLLEAAARDSGCGLDVDERGLVQAWGPSLVEAIAFARALIARRRDFEALGEPFPREDASGGDYSDW